MSGFEREVIPASFGVASEFYNNAIRELDGYMINQDEGKDGMIIAMGAGLNIALVGEPGGGKTMLAKASPNLIADLAPEDIFRLPIQVDLRPEQVIGGQLITSKQVEVVPVGSSEAEVHSETSTIDIDALMHRNTKVIIGNEFNRVNPHVRNSMLEAFESGEVDRAGGTDVLDLVYTVATMNPGDRKQGVLPINPAEASRHAIGVAMGNEADGQARRDAIFGMSNWRPEPVKPVTDLETLRAIRTLARSESKVVFPESLRRDEFVDAVIGTQKALLDRGIDEADYRIANQVTRISRATAALKGENEGISKEHIHQAVRFLIGARVGMLTVKDSTVVKSRIDEAVDQAIGDVS